MEGGMSGNIKVFARVRPENELERSKKGSYNCVTVCSESEIKVDTAEPIPDFPSCPSPSPRRLSTHNVLTPMGKERKRMSVGRCMTSLPASTQSQTYSFDKIFPPESSQQDVFNHIGMPLVETVFQGYNGTIFAYGQTSSGKTYTMQGPDIMDSVYAGVIPRTVGAIFDAIENAANTLEFTVRASYVEIYLERIRDLLNTSNTNLSIREDPSRGIYVQGMVEQYVDSVEEVMDIMYTGSENRAQCATGMNKGSSRSHSVFQLQIEQKELENGKTITSKVNLVDLAGSEVVRKTGAKGAQLDEAKMINLSLSALGNVIKSLTDGRSTHIPYRDSKLTRMLQESLGGNARTWLIINISPSSYNVAESLSTLRFGTRAKAIKNKAIVNQVRTVEELDLLLLKAEKAIDVQARYIKKLEQREATRIRRPHIGEEPVCSNSNDSSFDDLSTVGSQNELDLEQEKLLHRNIALEQMVQELKEQAKADKEEISRSHSEIGILTEEIKVQKKVIQEKSIDVQREVERNNRLERLLKTDSGICNKTGETTISTSNYSKNMDISRTSKNQENMKALELRLGQLVEVHRQLLRKYATLELASVQAAEKHEMEIQALKNEKFRALHSPTKASRIVKKIRGSRNNRAEQANVDPLFVSTSPLEQMFS